MMVQVVTQVDGMRCEMCESHVCDQLRKIPGVKRAKASHSRNTATVVAEDNIDLVALKAAVMTQGYRVGEISTVPYQKKGLFGLFRFQ